MNDGFPYIDLILLAGVALFIALRLRATLGKKIGFDGTPAVEKSQVEQFLGRRAPEETEKEKQKIDAAESIVVARLAENVKTDLAALKQRFPDFSANAFLEGARTALDMVFEAFAKGDKATLKLLLTDGLQQHFLKEIDTRDTADEKTENTLVAIESADIVSVRLLQDTSAEITVKFVSEQIHVVRNRDGKIIEGDPSQLVQVEDEWTFRRDMRSRDPNWHITSL
jgi:predicted lipid-binding transport protein (Tim44 family)